LKKHISSGQNVFFGQDFATLAKTGREGEWSNGTKFMVTNDHARRRLLSFLIHHSTTLAKILSREKKKGPKM
jgi:hypothetical protein